MKSKLIENAGYISIALVLALTLVLSFSAVVFNPGLIAHAEEEPSENGIFIYPGSTSLVLSGFDPFASELFYSDESGDHLGAINSGLAVDLTSIESNPGSLLQFIFYADVSRVSDEYIYLSGIALPYSYYVTASDLGWEDRFFVFGYEFYDDPDTGDDRILVMFHQFLDDYYSDNFETIYLYDIRLIEPQTNNNNSTADSFLSIVGDGISFGFESIADGITYTVENLFFTEEGTLSDFSIIIFCLTGVSLALAVIKYILRIIFSFGGVKL